MSYEGGETVGDGTVEESGGALKGKVNGEGVNGRHRGGCKRDRKGWLMEWAVMEC